MAFFWQKSVSHYFEKRIENFTETEINQLLKDLSAEQGRISRDAWHFLLSQFTPSFLKKMKEYNLTSEELNSAISYFCEDLLINYLHKYNPEKSHFIYWISKYVWKYSFLNWLKQHNPPKTREPKDEDFSSQQGESEWNLPETEGEIFKRTIPLKKDIVTIINTLDLKPPKDEIAWGQIPYIDEDGKIITPKERKILCQELGVSASMVSNTMKGIIIPYMKDKYPYLAYHLWSKRKKKK